jgi:predicted nucleotide-binding protein
MPDLTKLDKLSILKGLVKRVKNWRFQKSLPMTLFLGKSDFSRSSPEFKQWLEDANEGITVIFGKYSHWVPDFKDIEYYEKMSALPGDAKANESNFWKGLDQAQSLLELMIEEIEADRTEATIAASVETPHLVEGKHCIFIDHGRSPLWREVKSFLEDALGLSVVCYESESRVGKSIVPILEKMLAEANFAVLILTGEDETATGSVRARQNVIHEIGLFQSRLGFNRAILLKQEGVENFTNVDGLQYIPFAENRIEQTFHELIRALKREELLPGT